MDHSFSGRELTVILSLITGFVWGCWILATGFALNIAVQGLIPWTKGGEENIYLNLFPAALIIVTVGAAWVRNSRSLAWCIPAIPVIGTILFFVKIAAAMSAFK